MAKTFKLTRTDSTFILPVPDLIATTQAKSNEETRYYLNGVYCERDHKGVVRMVATDGKLLIETEVDPEAHIGAECFTQEADETGGFIMRVDVQEKAFKVKSKGRLWIHGDIETGILQVFDTDPCEDVAERVGVCEFERIDGTFPDYRRVIPAQPTNPGAFCLDLDLVDKVRKALKVYDRNAMAVFSPNTSTDPVLITAKLVPGFRAVCMPVRF